jgi:hypothetical protein
LEILRELMVHGTAVIEKGKLPAAIPSRTSANNRRSIASLLRSLSVRAFAEGKLESTVWIFRVIFSQQAFRAGTVASQCEADAPANTREMDQRRGWSIDTIVTDIFRNAHYHAPQPFGTPFLASRFVEIMATRGGRLRRQPQMHPLSFSSAIANPPSATLGMHPCPDH